MPTIVNKTFEEIAVGDTTSVQGRLQAGDLRAWEAAFGEIVHCSLWREPSRGGHRYSDADGACRLIASRTGRLRPYRLGAHQGRIAHRHLHGRVPRRAREARSVLCDHQRKNQPQNL